MTTGISAKATGASHHPDSSSRTNHLGKIRAVLENPLPYPRDEHHPAFVALIEKLHALITKAVADPQFRKPHRDAFSIS